MNPINTLLSLAGLRLSRRPKAEAVPDAFVREYRAALARLRANAPSWSIYEHFYHEAGPHPDHYRDRECAFAAGHLATIRPDTVLDIGSYRLFVLGMLASYRVTTIDVRPRDPLSPRETVLTCDAKALDLPDESFDAVVSLCALEHFGLGRYGDAFDLHADSKAMREMRRVLKPGGYLILTTNITGARPAIVFNAHRVYSHGHLGELCEGLEPVEERVFNPRENRFVALDAMDTPPGDYDIYMGCWRRP
ncbi:MAG: hypothetical protein AUI36_14575 [Cyanobacteria bacterium 13_1_40CM_2_61_4]|nr:MAG: hypothetical protein AUI36_14575 [Cyanobacteria bacterium 13_1_40CM_2_61_4]